MPVDASIQASLSRLESTRLRNLRKIKVQTGLYTLAVLILASLFFSFVTSDSDDGGGAGALLFPLLFAGGLGYYFYRWLTKKVKDDFKSRLIPALLLEIDPSLTYQAEGGLPVQDVLEAKLFNRKRFTQYETQDRVGGKVGSTQISFALSRIREEQDQSVATQLLWNENASTRDVVTIFEGLLFVADFNKHFSSRTYLNQPNHSTVGDLFGNRVELEDPEFNSLFTVHSTDPVEARYLLSPSLMEKFKALRARGELIASFADGKLWLALSMPMGTLDPDLSTPFTDASQITRILAQLRSLLGIVDELGLNARIWTKS